VVWSFQERFDFVRSPENPLVGFALEFVFHSDDMAPGSAHDHDVADVHIIMHAIGDMVGKDFRSWAIEGCR